MACRAANDAPGLNSMVAWAAAPIFTNAVRAAAVKSAGHARALEVVCVLAAGWWFICLIVYFCTFFLLELVGCTGMATVGSLDLLFCIGE